MYKEKKLAGLQQGKDRLQLLKMTEDPGYSNYIKYQVRLNRKVIKTSISEYTMRKLFATYAQNMILQLKIY